MEERIETIERNDEIDYSCSIDGDDVFPKVFLAKSTLLLRIKRPH